MDKASVEHVLGLLNSADRTDQNLGIGILDQHLRQNSAPYPNLLLETVYPLARMMEDPVLARRGLSIQVEIASIIAYMARMANPNDLRYPDLLLPLVRALRRRDGLASHAEHLLVGLGLPGKQVTNIYFAFRETVGSERGVIAIEWLVRHGTATAALALIDFLNHPQFHVVNGALQWIENMALRIFQGRQYTALDRGEEAIHTLLDLYLPRQEQRRRENPEMLRYLHCMGPLVAAVHRQAQWYRSQDQVRFIHSNVEAHVGKVLEMCRTVDAVDAFLRALSRGCEVARRRYGEHDPQLNYIVLNLALAAEDHTRELGIESKYLAR
jgi:hypothetical protein